MGNVIGAALQEFVDMATNALTRPGPWSAVAVVIGIVLLAAMLRSKISASWVWIPVMVAAIYFAVYRWLRLR
jgi:hypothetical protein